MPPGCRGPEPDRPFIGTELTLFRMVQLHDAKLLDPAFSVPEKAQNVELDEAWGGVRMGIEKIGNGFEKCPLNNRGNFRVPDFRLALGGCFSSRIGHLPRAKPGGG